MAFRKDRCCSLAASTLFLATVFLCASAVAQTAQSFNDARTSSITKAPAAQSHSSYVPASKAIRHATPAPTLIYSVDPQFPANAPKGKFSGIAVVSMIVDTNGKPEQVHVVKPLGPEFDKAAVAAVKQYRFRPALQNGKPVPVKVNVEVDFRRY